MSRRDLSAVLRKRAEQSCTAGKTCKHQNRRSIRRMICCSAMFPRQFPSANKRSPRNSFFRFAPPISVFDHTARKICARWRTILQRTGCWSGSRFARYRRGMKILSGHNRVNACRLLGWREIEADVEQVDDDRAIVIATVTNLQRRQGLLPSERGWAYRALLEAHRHQGKRNDLICAQNEHRSKKRETR